MGPKIKIINGLQLLSYDRWNSAGYNLFSLDPAVSLFLINGFSQGIPLLIEKQRNIRDKDKNKEERSDIMEGSLIRFTDLTIICTLLLLTCLSLSLIYFTKKRLIFPISTLLLNF